MLLLVIYYKSLSHKIFEVAAFLLYFRVYNNILLILRFKLPIAEILILMIILLYPIKFYFRFSCIK